MMLFSIDYTEMAELTASTESQTSRQYQTGPHLRLLLDLTRRDIKLRYLGSLLGVSWHVIHPLVMILIYTLVFSNVMKARLPGDTGMFSYGLYLCSGILSWGAFVETLSRSVSTLQDNAGFIKKVSFPPVILFGSTYLATLFNFVLGYAIFIGFAIFAGKITFGGIILGLVVTMLFNLLALGIGMALGCINVFLRDIQQLVLVVLQLWFWTTPIVYLVSSLPEFALPIVKLNPAYYYVDALHQLLYFQTWPSLTRWTLMVAMAAASVLLGLVVYKRAIGFVRDEL